MYACYLQLRTYLCSDVLMCTYIECTAKTVYSNTTGSTVLCCYNQVVVVTSTICTETSETVPNMCVVVKERDDVSSDFVNVNQLYFLPCRPVKHTPVNPNGTCVQYRVTVACVRVFSTE